MKPGQAAPEPFADFRKILDGMDESQKTAAIGKSCYRLLKAGVVTWDEIVTPARVRSLRELVSRQRLSVEQMIKAGVNPRIAAQAHGAVHTPEHVAVAAHRKELLQKIHGAGVSHDMVVQHIGERIASRVTVAPGPSYTTKTTTPAGPAGTVLPGIRGGHLIDAAAQRQRHADELAKLLSRPTIAKAALRRAPKAKVANPETGPPSAPAPAGPPTMDRLIAYGVEQGHELRRIDAAELKSRFGWDDFKIAQAPAFYSYGDRKVYINTSAKFWAASDLDAERASEGNWVVRKDARGLIDHEIGHAKHHAAAGEKARNANPDWLGKLSEGGFEKQQQITKAVSGYAAMNPQEFVAEVYSGLAVGREFPGWVMDLYRAHEGPNP